MIHCEADKQRASFDCDSEGLTGWAANDYHHFWRCPGVAGPGVERRFKQPSLAAAGAFAVNTRIA
jgi:hypothetical protein